jgi:hypothetical protein
MMISSGASWDRNSTYINNNHARYAFIIISTGLEFYGEWTEAQSCKLSLLD